MEEIQHRLANFITWFTSNGGFIHSSTEFVYEENKGTHLRVKPSAAPISPGISLISCPHSLSLSSLNAVNVLPLFPARAQIHALPPELLEAARPQSIAAFWLCMQWLHEESSWWAPYVKCLPSPPDAAHKGIGVVDTPVWWDDAARDSVSGTSLENGLRDLEKLWQSDWQKFGAVMTQWGKRSNVNITWNLYKWALTILGSRAFTSAQLSNILLPSGTAVLDHHNPDMLLYPGLDMLNHSPETTNRWQHDANEFRIIAKDMILAGAEIWNPYGAKTNGELLLSFGFCVANNPHDAFALKVTSTSHPLLELVVEANPENLAEPTTNDPHQAKDPNDDDDVSPHNRPKPFDLANNVYYVRSTNRFHLAEMGYPVSTALEPEFGHLLGFPWSFLSYFASVLANSREATAIRAKPGDFSAAKLYRQVGGHAKLAITVLLLARLRMELRKLEQSESKRTEISQQRRYVQIYRDGQKQILLGNIDVMQRMINKAVTLENSHSVPELVTLPLALTWLHGRFPGKYRDEVLPGMVAALGIHSGAKVAHPLHWRTLSVEEDAWTLWLGAMFTLQQRYGDESDGSDSNNSVGPPHGLFTWLQDMQTSYPTAVAVMTGEDDSIYTHISDLLAAIRRHHPSSALWTTETWTASLIRWCARIVQEESIAVVLDGEGYAAVRSAEDEHYGVVGCCDEEPEGDHVRLVAMYMR